MYRRIVWCYILVLSLVDISLKNKFRALGKSHDVNANGHKSLPYGFNVHDEWGEKAEKEAQALGIRLEPPQLEFSSRPLGEAHRAVVTLLNTGSDVLHLASVAGTTPDFHASFFEDKSVAAGGNTTFSVVFAGLQLGPSSDALVLQSSRGALRYRVAASGQAPRYGLWPVLVHCPDNTTVSVPLQLYNPTSDTVQVTEVYSSGSWLGIEVPAVESGGGGGGGGSAGGAVRGGAWSVRAGRWAALARLRLPCPAPGRDRDRDPSPAAGSDRGSATAWVRVRGPALPNTLLLPVEGLLGPAGLWPEPAQLRLGAASSDTPAEQVIHIGNSHHQRIQLTVSVYQRCQPYPNQPPNPVNTGPAAATKPASHAQQWANGAAMNGVTVTQLADYAEPHQSLTPTAKLTFNFGEMWSAFVLEHGDRRVTELRPEAWCAGWAVVGGVGGVGGVGSVGVPFSVRLMAGGVQLTTEHIRVIREDRDAMAKRELRLQNGLLVPLRVIAMEVGPEVDDYFTIEDLSPLTVSPEAETAWARIALRSDAPAPPLSSWIAVTTNASRYVVEVSAYSGFLNISWEWPYSLRSGASLSLGTVPVASTRRVPFWLQNPAPRPLCATALSAELGGGAGASVAIPACQGHQPPDHACRCVPGGGSLGAVLTVVAGSRAGPLTGRLSLATAAGQRTVRITATALQGRVRIRPLRLGAVAPFAGARAPLVLDNSMPVTMALLAVDQPKERHDPALTIQATLPLSLGPGATSAGWVTYSPEQACGTHCYTGLGPHEAAWTARVDSAASQPDDVIARDLAALEENYRLFEPKQFNVTVLVRTSEVALVKGWGAVRWVWPRLRAESEGAESEGAGSEGAGSEGAGSEGAESEGAEGPGWVCSVGGSALRTVTVTNPGHTPLLLQPVIAAPIHMPSGAGSAWSAWCVSSGCVPRPRAFAVRGWERAGGAVGAVGARRGRGRAGGAGPGAAGAPLLLLGPLATVSLTLLFRPDDQLPMAAGLYLRNNLTVLEVIALSGRGAEPRLTLDGLAPHKGPLLFEVSDCGTLPTGGGGISRRVVVARNAGAAPLSLSGWAIAGRACHGRGFTLEPCQPLLLQPNETQQITITFATDYSLSLVSATLSVSTEALALQFPLQGRVPRAVAAHCRPGCVPPPWDGALRSAGCAVAVVAALVVLAAGAMDAERLLRRARAARAVGRGRPLDLRAAGTLGSAGSAAGPGAGSAPPAPAPPRVPRRRRRKPADPANESHAFDRWRQELGLHAPTDHDMTATKQTPEQIDADEDAGSTGSSELSSSPAEHDDNDNDNEHEDDDHDDHDQHDDDDDGGISCVMSSHEDGYEMHDSDEHNTPPPSGPPRSRSRSAPRGARGGGESPPPPYSAVVPPPPLSPRPRLRRAPPRRRSRHARVAPPSDVAAPTAITAACGSATPATGQHAGNTGSNGNTNGSSAGGSGSVRWGASWSSVVLGAGAGSVPPRPSPPPVTTPAPNTPVTAPAADHSLFYFNGNRDSRYRWEAPAHAQRPFNDYLEEKSPSPGPVGAPVGSKSYGPWSGLDVGRGNLDPVGRNNLDTVLRSTLDPVGRGSMDPIVRNLDPVQRGNLDSVGRASMDSMGRANLDPVGRNLDTIVRSNLESVARGNFDSSPRISSNPVVRNLETNRGGFDAGLDAMGRANMDSTNRGKSNAVRSNMDQVGRVLDPVGRGNSPVIRNNLEPCRGALDPVVRGSAAPLEPPPPGWAWLRPPPGFAPPAAPVPPPAAPRPYDPFQSLAAIWSRNALDWRDDDPTQPPNRTQHHQH